MDFVGASLQRKQLLQKVNKIKRQNFVSHNEYIHGQDGGSVNTSVKDVFSDVLAKRDSSKGIQDPVDGGTDDQHSILKELTVFVGLFKEPLYEYVDHGKISKRTMLTLMLNCLENESCRRTAKNLYDRFLSFIAKRENVMYTTMGLRALAVVLKGLEHFSHSPKEVIILEPESLSCKDNIPGQDVAPMDVNNDVLAKGNSSTEIQHPGNGGTAGQLPGVKLVGRPLTWTLKAPSTIVFVLAVSFGVLGGAMYLKKKFSG